MKVYVVILLYMDSDSTGEVFLDKASAEIYGKRQLIKDEWLQGFSIVERVIRGKVVQ